MPNSFREKAANPNPIKQPSVSIFIPHKSTTSGLINGVRLSLERWKKKGIDRLGEKGHDINQHHPCKPLDRNKVVNSGAT